ncbi:MAG: LacI family DNA-binding transcriptional regulator [Chloroflexota bacterium]
MRNGRRTSLEDVAGKAGVSRSTVSRVINNDPNVKAETREHVLKIIEQERYNPSAVARSMVTGRTQVIGVVFPHEYHVFFNDPYYFPALLQGVASMATERDYAMLLWVRQSGEDAGIFYRRILQNGLMDGVIIASDSKNSLVTYLADMGVPLATVERPSILQDRVSYVSIDNIGATRIAIEHLISLGRRKIALIAGATDNMDAQERLEGFRLVMADAGLPADMIVYGNFQRRSAYEATKLLLDKDIDAIFACSDVMAQGAYEALYEAGLRVPDDVAVVGFDDLPTAAQLRPPLTTIRQPISEKGSAATSLLLDAIEGKTHAAQHVVLPTTLIIRESTGVVHEPAEAPSAS